MRLPRECIHGFFHISGSPARKQGDLYQIQRLLKICQQIPPILNPD